MSKKLIAVASAAALALSALVGIAPASAAAFGVVETGAVTSTVDRNGSTSAKAYQLNVPSSDVLREVTTADHTTGTALKLVITTAGDTDAITVTATGGVEVLTDTAFAETSPAATTATGTQALTDVAASGSATIYAYTTSTSAGTVVISAGGSSKTIYITGLSTFAYNISFTAAATSAISGEWTLTGTIKDAFGNNLTTALGASDMTVTILGGSASAAAADPAAADFDYNATTKVYTIDGDVRDSAGTQAVSLAIDAAKSATKVTAFGTPVTNQFFVVTAVDLATQVTNLTAQVAALTADYNALAAKWNKRLALKKAPKNAATLK
jgi:outer membrane murein-binding lipoprotein Lpp